MAAHDDNKHDAAFDFRRDSELGTPNAEESLFVARTSAASATPIDDILTWAGSKLTAWRQDALRRLACYGSLSGSDHDELLDMIKGSSGFVLSKPPSTPSPLDKTHFSSVSAGPSVRLKGIRSVKNVNRLVPEASMDFGPKGLTVIYGRNGSGKSGFVRILRTACRSRIEDPAKLRVLADVYGSGGGPQEAELVVESGGTEVTIPWKPGMQASELLLQVGVFDTHAAQLYVDQGNQILFLPFGLALPHKLNELCLSLKDRLEQERKPVTQQIDLAALVFETVRSSVAQSFYSKLTGLTTDAAIDTACTFSKKDEERLTELNQILVSKGTTEIDLRALANWSSATAFDADVAAQSLGDGNIAGFETLRQKAIGARTAASADADSLFSGEPLKGVGQETWRVLWNAAKEYSTHEAYHGEQFPVVSKEGQEEHCVLCQQPLSAEASDRLTRFYNFVDGALAKAANDAEQALQVASDALPGLNAFTGKDWPARVEQIRKRDQKLASDLEIFKSTMVERRSRALDLFDVKKIAATTPLLPIQAIAASFTSLGTKLTAEADALAAAGDAQTRLALIIEQAELTDRKVLSVGKAVLAKRRDLLKQDSAFDKALAEVQTKGITQRANELVDVHLTKAVTDQFDDERKILEISHLKIGLSRMSGQTKASFQTDTGVKLAKASDILSEGEQRALALSAFLTEVSVMPGDGPIVVDDPVSSLDRERGLKVAQRLVGEASKRQVVVFTHDLVFFNDLCREAEERVDLKTVALFSDGANAGKIDPAGVAWQGLPVKKRLGLIRNEFAQVRKLVASSPTDYEFQTKHLYSRLRDAYERMVEELIFCDVVRRGVDRVETQKLRYVHLSDALAIQFNNGMTKVNTYSHDNPASATVTIPKPADVDADLDFFQKLMDDLKAESDASEKKRPSMKKK